MKVALDTNVVHQALHNSAGASHAILQMIRAGDVQMAISVPVFEEYRDVLHRPNTLQKMGRSREDMQKILDFIALVGVVAPIDCLWRPNLQDEAGNKFVELAVASGSEFLITRNVRYTIDTEHTFDSFRITTPSDFLKTWRKRHAKREEEHPDHTRPRGS